MKKLSKSKKIIGLVSILVVAGLSIYFAMNQRVVREVEAYEVTGGSIEMYVEEIGNVKVHQSEAVFANLSGQVTEIFFEVGDEVKKGDVLVKLDSQDQARDIRLLEAQKAALRAGYKQSMEPVDEMQIEKLALSIETFENNLQEEEQLLEDQKALYDAGVLAEQEYRNSLLSFESRQAELKALKLDLALLKKPISSTVTEQYQANLLQLDLQIEAVRSNEGDFSYSAPFDGTILEKNIEVGSFVQQGASVFEIGNLEDLYIEGDILVADIGDVFLGGQVRIENEDLGLADLMGKVTKIHPQAFSKISDLGVDQKRIKVEIAMDEIPEIIRPGYDLDIKIITAAKENVLLAPENAFFELDGKDYVFVIEEGIAALRPVETGIESERQVEIVSGLSKGEMIILSPEEDLKVGETVQFRF